MAGQKQQRGSSHCSPRHCKHQRMTCDPDLGALCYSAWQRQALAPDHLTQPPTVGPKACISKRVLLHEVHCSEKGKLVLCRKIQILFCIRVMPREIRYVRPSMVVGASWGFSGGARTAEHSQVTAITITVAVSFAGFPHSTLLEGGGIRGCCAHCVDLLQSFASTPAPSQQDYQHQ